MRLLQFSSHVLLALFLGCEPKPSGSLDQPIAPLLQQARKLAEQGFYTEAAQFLSSSQQPRKADDGATLALEIARLYLRANVHDLALSAAQNALKLGSKEPDALYVEAESMRHLRLPGAQDKLQSLLALAPTHWQAKLSLARIRMHATDPASALPLFDEYFQQVQASDADYKIATLEHARALRNAGHHQAAADRYVALLEDDPLEGVFYSGLAEALYRLKLRQEGRFVEDIYKLIARSSFEEHVEDRLRETGNTAFAQGQRAVNRTRQRRYLEAFQSYYRALELDRSDARLPVLFSDLAIQFRRFSEARATLSHAIEIGKKPLSGLHWMLGRVALEVKDFRQAASSFQSALDVLRSEGDQGGSERGQAPELSLRLALARSWIELKETDRARRALLAARELSPTSWEPAYWLGRVELLAGQPQNAQALFAAAAQSGGKDVADLGVYAAVASEKMGRVSEAVSKLEALIAAQPNLTPAHEELVRIKKSQAEAPAAEEALTQLLNAHEEIRGVEARLKDLPLAACGELYLELGKRHLARLDPRAFDFLFLASDLLPRNAEACRLLLAGLRQSQDVFVKLRYLRRLHELEPQDSAALTQLAVIYLKLHVRLDEAERFSRALHQLKATPESYRLCVRAAHLRGEDARARAILQEALAAFPSSTELRDLSLPPPGSG